MNVATPAPATETKQGVVSPVKGLAPNPEFVSVYLRQEAIARLKWLNNTYIGEASLDDALDKVLSLAADAYRQKSKIGLVIGNIQPKKEDKLVPILLREKAIANLKWLNINYIHQGSLDDALDTAIAVAGFMYKQLKSKVITVSDSFRLPQRPLKDFVGVN